MFMQLNQEIFAIKLYELEQQYGQMISRLRLCRENSQETIRQKRRALQDEYREHDLQLKTTAESSRSPAVADLARLHLECFQGAEEILSRNFPLTCTANQAASRKIRQKRPPFTRNTPLILPSSPCATR